MATSSAATVSCCIARGCSAGLGEVERCYNSDGNSFALVTQHESTELREVLECFNANALSGFEADQARLRDKRLDKKGIGFAKTCENCDRDTDERRKSNEY